MSIAGDNNPSRKNGSLSGSLSSLSSALRSASLGDGVASSNAGVLNTYRSEEERIEAALFSLGKGIFEAQMI